MTAPDFLPVLSGGAHTSPKEGACVMEYVSVLAGEPWTDRPKCTHPALATLAININDRLEDGERQVLVPLIPRLIGTATDDPHVNIALAVYLLRKTYGIVWPSWAREMLPAWDALDRWARHDESVTVDDLCLAATAAATAAAATATATAAAAAAATTATAATAAATATATAATAATAAAATATAAAATAAAATATAAATTATGATTATAATAAATATATAATAATAAAATAAATATAAAAAAAAAAATTATGATTATAGAAAASLYGSRLNLVDVLTGALDVYDDVTGRTRSDLDEKQWRDLAAVVA